MASRSQEDATRRFILSVNSWILPWGSIGNSATQLQVIFQKTHRGDCIFLWFFYNFLVAAFLPFHLVNPTQQFKSANFNVNRLARRWFGLSVGHLFPTPCLADSTLELIFIAEDYEMQFPVVQDLTLQLQQVISVLNTTSSCISSAICVTKTYMIASLDCVSTHKGRGRQWSE